MTSEISSTATAVTKKSWKVLRMKVMADVASDAMKRMPVVVSLSTDCRVTGSTREVTIGTPVTKLCDAKRPLNVVVPL